jgi:aspartyl-tRNA(Asn)/glutamyl-tRNA(Gln) amidotransferase subunit A
LVREETNRFFEQFDFFISPVTPTTAFTIGEKTEDPLQMYLADVFTVQANVVGNPAIAVPNGFDQQGMPIGIQIMAPYFGEEKMLAFADYLTRLNQKVAEKYSANQEV